MTSIIKVDQIQNAAGTTGLTIDSDGVVSKSVVPAWRVAHNGDFNVTVSGTSVTIEFDKTSSSENCFLSGGCTLSNGVITVSKAGIYQINANVRFDDVGVGYVTARLVVNSYDSGAADTYNIDGDPATNYATLSPSDVFKLDANDTIEVLVFAYTDSSYHVAGDSSFSGVMIG